MRHRDKCPWRLFYLIFLLREKPPRQATSEIASRSLRPFEITSSGANLQAKTGASRPDGGRAPELHFSDRLF